MAIRNPQANFNFRLQLRGIDNVRTQVVTAPSVEWAEHKGGAEGNSPDVKTPGKKIVGDLVVEIQVPDTGDGEVYAAFQAAETMARPLYCGDGFLYETNALGVPVQTFRISNAWLKKVETSSYDRKGDSSADLIRTCTFSVEDYRPQ